MVQPQSPGAARQGGSREDRQGEDIQVVGVEGEGKLQAFPETVIAVAGKSVDEIEAEDDPGLVEKADPPAEIGPIQPSPHPGEHLGMGALEADLEGTGDLRKEPGLLIIDEFVPELEMKMDPSPFAVKAAYIFFIFRYFE